MSAAQIPAPVLLFCVLPLAVLGLLLAYRAKEDRGARMLIA